MLTPSPLPFAFCLPFAICPLPFALVALLPALYFLGFGAIVTTAAIPNRAVFRSQDVCEIAQVQPYVLRSWEAEFPDLGHAKSAGAPRVYRRADVERVLRLKHLLFVEGLTLAGARRELGAETTAAAPVFTEAEETVIDADVAKLLDKQTQRSLRDVRQGLQWILGVLSGRKGHQEEFRLTSVPGRGPAKKKAHFAKSTKPKTPTKVRLKAVGKPSRASTAKPKTSKAVKKVAGNKKKR